MGTLFATENVKLAEEEFGLLYLYLKDTTVDFHQNTEYDLSITFDGLAYNDIRGLANALLLYLDGDDSIE
jgi:hypothetical protein